MSAKPGLSKQTDIPAEAPNSARRFFGVFRYSKRALELVWATSPKLALFLGFVTLLAGVLPSAVAWVGARIVDSVVGGRHGVRRRWRRRSRARDRAGCWPRR